MGMNVRVATPPGYAPKAEIVEKARKLAANPEQIIITHSPEEAVDKAQVLYTDVWVSMGQEGEAAKKIPSFQPYQLNERLVSLADKEAIVLHCLPAYRGKEITAEVLEGRQSRVWDEAENRMHAQKALMACLLGLT